MKLPSLFAVVFLAFVLAPIASGRASFAGKLTYDQLVAQAKGLDSDGDQLAAFIDYYQAALLKPDGTEASDALISALHDGLPERVPQFVFSDPDNGVCPLKRDLFVNGDLLAISPRVGEIAPISDPQNNWPFTRLTYFYMQSSDGDWECYAIVHSQLPEDQALGVRMGRLLYLLREALVSETGHNPLTDGQPFGVWLARHDGDSAGAQEWRNNIYFYDVTRPRSNIEWIREIAHEFSHLALPAIGGDYSDPEPWANGYYGERLLVRWLARGAAGGPKAVIANFGWPFYGYSNFQKLLIDPYIAEFAKTGMNTDALNRHDGEGMRYLIGMLLTIDDHAGPKALGDMLWDLPQGATVEPNLLYSPSVAALALPAVAPVPLSPDIDAPKPPDAPGTSPATPSVPAKPAAPKPNGLAPSPTPAPPAPSSPATSTKPPSGKTPATPPSASPATPPAKPSAAPAKPSPPTPTAPSMKPTPAAPAPSAKPTPTPKPTVAPTPPATAPAEPAAPQTPPALAIDNTDSGAGGQAQVYGNKQ